MGVSSETLRWVVDHIQDDKRYQTEVNVTIAIPSLVIVATLIVSILLAIYEHLGFLALGFVLCLFILSFGILRPLRYLKAINTIVLYKGPFAETEINE
ncbi:MAG: hypothetical protein JW941_07565 [Candidatus Coatesbacteria bacterium]|nr:hypothetical protein [Candidatus Coatesbacteria bacterium]